MTMSDDPKWYDSVWLSAYFAAKDIVTRVAPERLDEFVRSFDILRTSPGFSARHLPQIIGPALLEQIRGIVRAIPRDKYEMHEMKLFGRFIVHDYPEITKLQNSLADKVSEWAGEAVEPSYNFLSLYTKMGVCEPHLDAPSAKWTLDICVDQSEPWPIHFSQIVPWPEQRSRLSDDWTREIKANASLHFSSLVLEPGDAILFSGSSQWHYRNALPRDGVKRHCDLLFLHFIPRGASEIVRPINWPGLFGIPELAGIPNLSEAL
jgi:hypothetical protein